MGGPELLAKEFGIYFIVKCSPRLHTVHEELPVSKTCGVSRIWEKRADL